MNPRPTCEVEPERTLKETAAYWLLRVRGGQISAKEQSELNAWLEAHASHQVAYDKAGRVWDVAGDVSAEDGVRAMRNAALAVRPERSIGGRMALPAVAAAAAIIVCVGWYVFGLLANHTAPSSVQSASGYRTGVGERLATVLEDGSSVVLNTDSALDLDFSATERRIYLRQGQALFEVAKDAGRPFVVVAGNRRITALGTAFDVRMDGEVLRVLMVEGRVAVDVSAQSTPHRPQLELEVGEQLIAAPTAPAVVKSVNVQRLTSWSAGRLVFQNESLADVIAEMNRYTSTPLIVEDASVAALRVSAVFRISQAHRFATSMTELFPLAAVKHSDGTVHLVRR